MSLPPVWEPDEAVTSCTTCQKEFWLFFRRHHCRNCGKIYCDKCSPHRKNIPVYGFNSPVRVCNSCNQVLCLPLSPPPPIATINRASSTFIPPPPPEDGIPQQNEEGSYHSQEELIPPPPPPPPQNEDDPPPQNEEVPPPPEDNINEFTDQQIPSEFYYQEFADDQQRNQFSEPPQNDKETTDWAHVVRENDEENIPKVVDDGSDSSFSDADVIPELPDEVPPQVQPQSQRQEPSIFYELPPFPT